MKTRTIEIVSLKLVGRKWRLGEPVETVPCLGDAAPRIAALQQANPGNRYAYRYADVEAPAGGGPAR